VSNVQTHANFLIYIFRASAQRFALPALGRAAERRPIGKRLRRRKRLGNAAESPASGARFVRRGFIYYDCVRQRTLLKQNMLAMKNLHLLSTNLFTISLMSLPIQPE